MPSGIYESGGKMQTTVQEDAEITIHQCAEETCKKETISV